MIALAIGLQICVLINIALMGYVDALSITYPNSKTHLEVFKLLLSFGCVLCSILMVMFHKMPTETRELALLGPISDVLLFPYYREAKMYLS